MCYFAYVVGWVILRDDGPTAVWIIAMAAGVGSGCAIHAIRRKAHEGWTHLAFHILAIAAFLSMGICFCTWKMFVAHWRQFFRLL